MYDVLKKYKENGHFFLKPDTDLVKVCNAPSKPGLFLTYSLNRGRIEFVYIGITDKTIEPVGLRDQIIKREKFLKAQIRKEGADALDIYWYVISSVSLKKLELTIIQDNIEFTGRIPRWNK